MATMDDQEIDGARDPDAEARYGVRDDVLSLGVEAFAADASVICLLRHSLRDDPDNDAPGHDAPLTPAGVSLALRSGRLLSRPVERLLSSPAPRCRDTADALAIGAGVALSVEVERCLAEPNAFAVDMERAVPAFRSGGAKGWVGAVLADPVSSGARSPIDGTERILDAVARICPSPGGVSLAITHDTVLAVVVHVLAGVSDVQEQLWPRMLEALCLAPTDEGWAWRWRALDGHWSASAAAIAPSYPLC